MSAPKASSLAGHVFSYADTFVATVCISLRPGKCGVPLHLVKRAAELLSVSESAERAEVGATNSDPALTTTQP